MSLQDAPPQRIGDSRAQYYRQAMKIFVLIALLASECASRPTA